MQRTQSISLATCLILVAGCGETAPGPTQPVEHHAGLGLSRPEAERARPETLAPAQVAAAFLSAIEAEDDDAWRALLTDAARAEFDRTGGEGMSFSGENVDAWSVGEEIIEAAEATVALVIETGGAEQLVSLKLRSESDGWRVSGMAITFGSGEFMIDFEGNDDALSELGEELAEGLASAMTEAFEGVMSEWSPGGSPEQIAVERAAYDALVPVDTRDHQAAWRYDLDASGRSGQDVIEDVLAGMALDAEQASLLQRPCTMRRRAISRLEAIELVCVELGVVPIYPAAASVWNDGSSEVTFRKGVRSLPVTFSGPFMLELMEVVEDAPNSTGEFTLVARALGLHPSVIATNEQSSETLTIARIASGAGASLVADDSIRWMGTPTVENGLLATSTSRDLVGLLRDVDSLSIAGTLQLALPGAIVKTSFPEGPSEDPAEAGPWSVLWKSGGNYNEFSLTHRDGEVVQACVRFAPDASDGTPMGIQSQSTYKGWENVSASLMTSEQPAVVGLKIFEAETLSYAFELGPIAFAKASQQPIVLETLAFTGAAPILVKFADFVDRSNTDFPTIKLHITSTSNLVIADAQVNFEYLDGRGEVLNDFPHSLSGELGFEGTQPLAEAGQSCDQTVTAFFMPLETKSVRARVDSVAFLNGTTWEAK